MEQIKQATSQSDEDNEKTSKSFDLQAFLKDNYGDKLIVLSKSNYHLIRRPLLVLFHHFKIKGAELKQWTDKLHETMLEFPETIQFAVMDFEDAELFHLSWNELSRFDFDASTTPHVFAVDVDDRQHDFDEEFTPTGLKSFCKYLENNKHYHSEQIIYVQHSSYYVETIIADNFRQLVEQNEKDVFITLHSKFSFKYELNLWGVPFKLRADNDNLVFYAINAYMNYIPLEFRASEFPTSFFIPRNNKKKRLQYINKYEDGEEIVRFIAKNASEELKTVDRMGRCKVLDDNSDHHETKEIRNDPLERLNTVLDNVLVKSHSTDDGFFGFLDSILKKISEEDRYNIEMELVTCVMNRINKG